MIPVPIKYFMSATLSNLKIFLSFIEKKIPKITTENKERIKHISIGVKPLFPAILEKSPILPHNTAATTISKYDIFFIFLFLYIFKILKVILQKLRVLD